MLHSYFVEYKVFRAHPLGSYYLPDNRPHKSIVCFVDVITPQNIETFKNVILKSYGEKHNIEMNMEKDTVEIINISYLGGK